MTHDQPNLPTSSLEVIIPHQKPTGTRTFLRKIHTEITSDKATTAGRHPTFFLSLFRLHELLRQVT